MVTNFLKLKVVNRWFFKNLSLDPCMDVLGLTLIQQLTAQYIDIEKKNKSASLFNIIQTFFQCILTSNIHINCLALWFTKAIVCCTGIISCISPIDVCYIQHLSFLHHNSISLVPRLLFGPGDVWFWLTQSGAG